MASSASARAETPTLVHADELGFTMDEDWRQVWRRVLDRGGRPDPTGPLQQRFANEQYPEHQTDQLVGDFMLAHEADWARSTNQIRFWIHSYNALELGNETQMKMGHEIGGDWRLDFRYDGLDNRVTASHMVTGEFTWAPEGKVGPYTTILINPRLEKQDTDLAVTVGYNAGRLGEARLRIFALDPFANASYALASHRKPPAQLIWKQIDLPLAFSLELLSAEWRGFHGELYLGSLPTQRRALYLGGLVEKYIREDLVWTLGGMLEWKMPDYPLWVGATGLVVTDRWKTFNTDDVAATRERIAERTVQTRAYAFITPRKDMLFETQLRVTARPESIFGPGDLHTEREDNEYIFGARGQWLFSSWFGTELSYWHSDRLAIGPPVVSVNDTGDRFVTRFLFNTGHGMLVSVGAGWDPSPRRSAIYAGGGGTITIDFD